MKVIVVSPHPDDETLGCGGTILRHRANGDEIYWLIMTNISTEEGYGEIEVKKRQEEIDAVSKEYKFKKVFKLDFPTTQLDIISRSQLVKSIANIIDNIRPNLVYLANRNDVHSDHKITFDAVVSSTKTFHCPFIKKILIYEVISETEFSPPLQNHTFIPNSYSDITKYIEQKIKIMDIYKGETAPHPFPRSVRNIRALATFRGAAAGVKYAEAFMVLKEIW